MIGFVFLALAGLSGLMAWVVFMIAQARRRVKVWRDIRDSYQTIADSRNNHG